MSGSTRWESVEGGIVRERAHKGAAEVVSVRLSVLTIEGQRVGQRLDIDGKRLDSARFNLLGDVLDRMVRDIERHGPMR